MSDGLVDARRIGCARIPAPAVGQPRHLALQVIVFLQYDVSDFGDHRFEVVLKDADGKDVDSQAAIGSPVLFHSEYEGTSPHIIELRMLVPVGRYEVWGVLDNETKATWPFFVDPP